MTGKQVSGADSAPETLPILYSFRRCPYAMRARLALAVSDTKCELREVVLRDKPAELLAASTKGTVPVLITGTVIDESLDIMLWSLRRNDPEEWLAPEHGTLADMLDLIHRCDDDFKTHLDRYKYPDRHGAVRDTHRAAGATFLHELNAILAQRAFLFGRRRTLADMAIVPFVRQFASTDETWFAGQSWSSLQAWLGNFMQSALFTRIMDKYPPWIAGAPGVLF